MKPKTKIKKTIPRNTSALAAKSRKAGPMKHRLEPKKGAKNEQKEILEDYNECICQLDDDDNYYCPVHSKSEEEYEF